MNSNYYTQPDSNGDQQENRIQQDSDNDSDSFNDNFNDNFSNSFNDSDDSVFPPRARRNRSFQEQAFDVTRNSPVQQRASPEQEHIAPGNHRTAPVQLRFVPGLHADDPRRLLEEGQPLMAIRLNNPNHLWMGNVEPYMTVNFIASAFEKMGEYPKSVRLMLDIFTNESVGYAYLDFYDPESVMTRLNGKIIPNTRPPVEFNLGRPMRARQLFYSSADHLISSENLFIKLSEIYPNVNDFELYKAFACRYQSIVSAFVDSASYSKKYGFVSFGSIEEHKHCLLYMNNLHYPTIGFKPLKIKSISKFEYEKAIKDADGYNKSLVYGEFIQTNYSQRHNMAFGRPINLKRSLEPDTTVNTMIVKTKENETIVDNKKEIDVDALNKESVSQDCNLRDALESSEWLPYISLDEFE